MINKYAYEAKTKEEVLSKALEELNVEEKDLYINDILEQSGLFKAKKFGIEVIKKDDVLKYIKEFIENLSKFMNIDIKSEVKYVDDIISVVLVSDNNPILIGKEGKNLLSIQTIIRQAVNNAVGNNIKINVDASNYKEKKIKNLEREIKNIARDVLQSHVDVKLDPMNSYERRVVHSLISEYENLETVSEGEAPNRYVTIKYIEK